MASRLQVLLQHSPVIYLSADIDCKCGWTPQLGDISYIRHTDAVLTRWEEAA